MNDRKKGGPKIEVYSNIWLVSLDGLVFNIFNFVQTKVAAALTCLFGDVCTYVYNVTSCFWIDTAMVHLTS